MWLRPMARHALGFCRVTLLYVADTCAIRLGICLLTPLIGLVAGCLCLWAAAVVDVDACGVEVVGLCPPCRVFVAAAALLSVVVLVVCGERRRL